MMPDAHFAVLDLGSNSFHMIVATLDEHNNLKVIDKMKDRVRLAAGLDDKKRLTPDAQQKALEYFERYSERLKDFQSGRVRCVATDTFRKAKNGQFFLEQAERTLGWPIEIISGIEEARLIYKGVSHDYPSNRRRFIVDIGGGSTELVIGTGPVPIQLASTKMGCVSWTRKFFRDGAIARESIDLAVTAAHQTLSSLVRKYRNLGWQEALGSSGTIRAIADILRETDRTDGTIQQDDLTWLLHTFSSHRHAKAIPFDAISDSRKEVLCGGTCILKAVMEALRIQQIRPVNSALREGVLIEMVGRVFGQDIREQTIDSLGRRLSIDPLQSLRVQQTAMYLSQSIQQSWHLTTEDQNLIRWAAHLHEIGLSIAFKGYHRHGSYILQNADMAGFSVPEQIDLSLLVGTHRGKIKAVSIEQQYGTLSPRQRKMIAVLRLASRLHRRRSPKPSVLPVSSAQGNHLRLSFPADYLSERSLTVADLNLEVHELARLNIQLSISTAPPSNA